jgi:L-aminopeptidase/D-esterase-like protein
MNRHHDGSDGSICDVPGIRVGHATIDDGPTGCTVILAPDRGAVAGVDVRGAAPGTRETDLLRPECSVERVHAILLSGGSAYGLDAATGVMRFLESSGIGYAMRSALVPIVPAAVIYDLGLGDGRVRPDAALGEAACRAATVAAPTEGSVGAGAGATVGKLFGPGGAMKGGIGTASARLESGATIGALVVVNALGDVVGEDGRILAGARDAEGWLATRTRAERSSTGVGSTRAQGAVGENTTIGLVATDLALDKAGATRLAQAAHDGLARATRPAHTAFDGDTFFALSTSAQDGRTWPVPADVTGLAADLVALAIRRAVRAASGRAGVPGLADLAVADRQSDGRAGETRFT